MGRLFGTDGVRGIANEELTCELALQIGRAAALLLTRHTDCRPRILIGRDTRISSEMLESALAAGICSVGANVELLGVIPTPAVAWLVPQYRADAGMMISASHNPVEFNGIKLFSRTGFKLPDKMEEEIEEMLFDHPEKILLKKGIGLGRISRCTSGVSDYVAHLCSTVESDLSGVKVAVDCANGSASTTAAQLFQKLRAEAHIFHASPNGENINDRCGSTHLDALVNEIKKTGCEVGVAFDGDADRCLAVDENGNRVDGDQILAIFALDGMERGTLSRNAAVVTVMSNLGICQFARENGIRIVQTAVGDRYVLEEMLREDYNLGGESSGHIILKDYANTGDGQLTAIQLLHLCKRKGKKLSELARMMTKLPQIIKTVSADAQMRAHFAEDAEIARVIEEVKKALGETGRVLVRASGTEPLIRVMLEGPEYDRINKYSDRIVSVMKERIDK